MTVCPKSEITDGSEKEPNKYLCLAADATRKVVKQTVGENLILFRAGSHLRTFGPTYDLEFFRLADPGCISFLKNNGTQTVFDAPGPPGTGACWASDATSFSAAVPENGPFWIDSAARA